MSNAPAPEPPLHTWADPLEAAAAGTRFDRIRVLAETASTQDAAARLAGYPHRPGGPGRQDHANLELAPQAPSDHEVPKPHAPSDLVATSAPLPAASPRDGGGTRPRPGLIVVAGRQTAGRGRHGRVWADTAGLGLAMTFVVDGAFDDRTLSLGAGLAALRAAEAALGDPAPSPLGLKWPNDVIERPRGALALPLDSDGAAGAAPRKLAGVLVERRGELALIGIGINVRQGPGDWPPGLAARGLSLRMLGSGASRLDVARDLLGHLDQSLRLDPAQLTAAWEASEVRITKVGEISAPNGRSV